MDNFRVSIICIIFILCSKFSFGQNPDFKFLNIGDTIPTVGVLKNASKLGSSDFQLSDFKENKGLILIFMTNNCYQCINYRERIKTLNEVYEKKGYPLIAINPYNSSYAVEDTFEEMEKVAKKEKFKFPYLQTPNEILPAKFGLKSTPTAYVFQKKNDTYILKYVGQIDDDMENKKLKRNNYVQNILDELTNITE